MDSGQAFLGDTLFVLNVTETRTVNQPKDIAYLMANIPIFVAALLVNISTISIIRRKEKTRIHKLIIFDCIANVISLAHGIFRYFGRHCT